MPYLTNSQLKSKDKEGSLTLAKEIISLNQELLVQKQSGNWQPNWVWERYEQPFF